MRALFLVLLLANILFLAWTQWIAPAPDAGGHPTPSSQGSKASACCGRNAARAARNRPSRRRRRAMGPGEAATCVSGGPVPGPQPRPNRRLRSSTASASPRGCRPSRDDVWVGQWVRIENLATPADAENALATIRAAGIPDAYLLTDEPAGNVVSLGVFGDAGRAARRSRIARQAGFTPKVEDHYRTEDVFWLDVDRDANAGLPGLEMFRVQEGPVPRVELRACPDPDSVTPAAPAP